MVAGPPPLILGGGGDLKISDQKNWGGGEGGPEQKIKFWGGGGEAMNPNDVMVVVLKDVLFCLLGFRFIYIVHIN